MKNVFVVCLYVYLSFFFIFIFISLVFMIVYDFFLYCSFGNNLLIVIGSNVFFMFKLLRWCFF